MRKNNGDREVTHSLKTGIKINVSYNSPLHTISSAYLLEALFYSLERFTINVANQNITLPANTYQTKGDQLTVLIDPGSSYSGVVQTTNTNMSSALTLTAGKIAFFISDGTKWYHVNVEGTGAGTKLYEFCFTDLSKPYVETPNAAYTVLANCVFRGTDAIGSITKFFANALSTAGDPCAVKVYDSTNAQTIAEVTNITGAAFLPVDMGAVSNLPTGVANFEIQGKATGSSKVRLGSLSGGF